MPMPNTMFAVKRELEFLRDWKDHAGQSIYNRDVRDLTSSEEVPLWKLADRLSKLAHYQGIAGLCEIASGAIRDGWMRCHLSFLYLFNSIVAKYVDFPRLRASQGEEWTLDTDITDFACCLMHAIVLSRSRERRIVAKMLLNAVDTQMCTASFLRSNPLPAFALWLNSMHADGDSSGKVPIANSCYQQVVSNWNSSDRLNDALKSLCDFHLNRMHTEESWESDDMYAFEGAYILFPVELAALIETRRLSGLEIPHVEHDFARTEFATPLNIPPLLDEVLNRVLGLDVLRTAIRYVDGFDS